jgi:hypothetical protein
VSYPKITMFSQELLDEIEAEILRGNQKHGHGELATPLQVTSILCEELGEYAQANMKNQPEHARKELIQIVAVAMNHLCGTGPHFSDK